VDFNTTAATIISDAAIDLGLTPTAIANPYASTDPNILQLNALLKRAGDALMRAHPWSHLQQPETFSTADGTDAYELPEGFDRIVDGTVWNRTSQMPLYGPLNGQQWQAEKARNTSGTAHQYFRLWVNYFYIHSTPSSEETIAYEYITRYWVDSAGVGSTDTDTPATANARPWFDPGLLVADLKRRYLKAKGFDSTAAENDFQAEWAKATGADGAAPVIDLAGRGGMRYLGGGNLPDTGFGG
jgi:hypothetical protein